MNENQTMVVVAGEPSGDMIAGQVVQAIQRRLGSVRFVGIGGDQMKKHGVLLAAHISNLSALGPTESVKVFPRWLDAWAQLRMLCKESNPLVAVLVDCPEVNLRLARALKADGVKVLQFMGPKVWAWRENRLGVLKARTDMVALGFAFEKKMYDAWGVNATFVGHPLLDVPCPPKRAEVRKFLHAPAHAKVVALLPGSRKSELKHHAEVMIETGIRLLKDGVIPVFAPFFQAASPQLLQKAATLGCVVWKRSVNELLCAADAVLVASGTATLEAALANVPMAIVYKMDVLNYMVARKLLDIPYVGLPNWIAGEKIVPELLQDAVTPQSLYQQALALLETGETKRQQTALAKVVQQMGSPGVADRAAQLAAELLNPMHVRT